MTEQEKRAEKRQRELTPREKMIAKVKSRKSKHILHTVFFVILAYASLFIIALSVVSAILHGLMTYQIMADQGIQNVPGEFGKLIASGDIPDNHIIFATMTGVMSAISVYVVAIFYTSIGSISQKIKDIDEAYKEEKEG